MKSKIYPVKVGDEIRQVTVPGSGDEEPAPETEHEFETFLAEAVEAYAESSDMPPTGRQHVRRGGLADHEPRGRRAHRRRRVPGHRREVQVTFNVPRSATGMVPATAAGHQQQGE